MKPAFRIPTLFVVSEVIDDEAVIMDLRSGNYFSATGAGGPIWRDLEAGRSYTQILRSLTGRYQVEPETLKLALDNFLAELAEYHLVEAVEDIPPESAIESETVLDAIPVGQHFDPPVLAMHTDMQDLLLLDPIHDVDAAGWPVRKA